MSKILITLTLLSLTLISCEESKKREAIEMPNGQVQVYLYEGCESVSFGAGKYKWGSHKGDCKNPIHNTKEK